MKRIFVLLISVLTLVPTFAQTQEEIEGWSQKGFDLIEQGNYTEAVKWCRKAAEQGYALAQNNLGWCYYNGWGVTQNYAEAAKWFRKAAEQGDALGQYILGVCYYNGNGVTQNYAEGVKWCRKSAQLGLAEAQYTLGWCYENGEGVSKNISEAVTWYRKAAEQGHAEAEKRLNECTKTQDDIQDMTGVSIAATTYIGDGEGGINIDDLKAAEPTGGHTTDDAPQEKEEVLDNAVVEVGATYPGGEAAILSHIAKNIRYPEIAIKRKIQGFVTVRFKIEKDGRVSSVYVAGSLSPECDREAVRVVKTLQRFTPAKQQGKIVAVWYTLPIRFQIK